MGLELTIGSDVSGLISGVNAATDRIQVLENRIASLQRIAASAGTDLGKFNKATDLIRASQTELNRVMSTGVPTFGRISNSANELEKRIRIATSAEHEFNAILGATPALLAGAENPAQALGHEFLILATGIQRAKEAGQTFSQISTTLLGSIFSLQGAITLGAALIFGFGKEIFGTGQKAKDAVDPIETLGKSVAEEAAKLTATVGLIENANTSNEDRAKALKAVNEQYGPLLKSMGIEEVTLGNIKAAYDTLIDSMLRRAVVKGLEDQIAEQVKKTATEIIKLKEAQENERIAEEKRAQAQKDGAQKSEDLTTSAKKLGDQLRGNQRAVSENTGTFLPFNKQQADAAAKMHDFDGRVNTLTESLKKQLTPLLSLTDKFSDLDIKLDKPRPPKLSKEDFTPRDINALLLEPETEIVPKISATQFKSDLEKAIPVIDDFHVKLGIVLDTQTGAEKQIDEIKKQLSEATSFNKILDLNVKLNEISPFEGITKEAAAMAKTVDGLVTPAFENLFTAIEQGGNPLKALFKGIESAVAQLIAKLIQAAIEAAIINAITGGGFAGATGFGGIFKKLLGFSEGGEVAGPGGPRSDAIPAMLSNGEYVMNASAVSKYGSGFMNMINSKRFADGGLVSNFGGTNADVVFSTNRVRNAIGGTAVNNNGGGKLETIIRGRDIALILQRNANSDLRTT